MAQATRVITGANQATGDNGGVTLFNGSDRVQVGGSNHSSFVGTISLQRRFSLDDGTRTAWESIRSWTNADFPLQQEFPVVRGFEFQLACTAYTSGSCRVILSQ